MTDGRRFGGLFLVFLREGSAHPTALMVYISRYPGHETRSVRHLCRDIQARSVAILQSGGSGDGTTTIYVFECFRQVARDSPEQTQTMTVG
ncbi:hypothetical protein B0H66DRAFT_553169 [Apodospora peruviana]|uniref:Uncharacterized protein n=1 Tax=Apodospora peruviana TaxID=516989 RepID=A0AAE0IBE2_9PEZI|nr:hypothetical protein B0H66DRAFT_553169 [Apodospora peruviana]